MATMILLRHGQSLWNKADLFTGWVDVPLSAKGIEEAKQAGRDISEYDIDTIFTSRLMRAKQTAMVAMTEHASTKVPVMIHDDPDMKERTTIFEKSTLDNVIPCFQDWRLNERYYGELQGANKQQTREKYGDEQVHIWRRSFDVPPPQGESLKMTCERTLPCLDERLIPALEEGQNILVSAHGNSLRSIVMHIQGLSPDEILALELPTGQPRVYDYSNKTFTLSKKLSTS